MSGLRASIRLYGLVKKLGSSDNPNRQLVDILCTVNRLGGKAIRAFFSGLDAELMTPSANHLRPASTDRLQHLAQPARRRHIYRAELVCR